VLGDALRRMAVTLCSPHSLNKMLDNEPSAWSLTTVRGTKLKEALRRVTSRDAND
jgi:hypothetical protein